MDEQENHMYYSYTRNEVKIPLHKVWDYIKKAYDDKCETLHNEFKVIHLYHILFIPKLNKK